MPVRKAVKCAPFFLANGRERSQRCREPAPSKEKITNCGGLSPGPSLRIHGLASGLGVPDDPGGPLDASDPGYFWLPSTMITPSTSTKARPVLAQVNFVLVDV